MPTQTRIRAVARERGLSASEVARRLGMFKSNLSALDAGKRSISLQALDRIAKLLRCSVSDLIETSPPRQNPLFSSPVLLDSLKQRDLGVPDGTERLWVHKVLLAWQRHYRQARRSS